MKTSFLEKVRKLCASLEDAPGKQDPELPEADDGLDAFFRRLKEMPYREPAPQARLDTELTELVNAFSVEELSEFLEALLLENPELMSLPLFPDTRHISKTEFAFNWLMHLPYSTLAKSRDIFVSLFEAALNGEMGEKGPLALNKIRALTAKNRIGLPYDYLERKVRSGELKPELHLQLAQLMVLHEDCDLDFAEAEALFSVRERPYLLPALMEAYLRAGLNGAKEALRALNQFGEKDFPVRAAELRPQMAYMLEEVARAFRKALPDRWEEELRRFVDEELEIENAWLRGMVEEEVPLQPATVKKGVKKQTGDTIAIEWPEFFLKAFNLKDRLSAELIKALAGAAVSNKEFKYQLYEAIAKGLRKYGERAAENAKPLLMYLNEEAEINLGKELRDWRIEFSPDPFRLRDPFMPQYTESSTSMQERYSEEESMIFQKAFQIADEDKRRLSLN